MVGFVNVSIPKDKKNCYKHLESVTMCVSVDGTEFYLCDDCARELIKKLEENLKYSERNDKDW